MSETQAAPIKKRDHLTCYYCGLRHDKVEAGGVYYCPNHLCTGPGAAHFRSKLRSYYESTAPAGRHTVDDIEWAGAAFRELFTDEKMDRTIKEHTLRWFMENDYFKDARSLLTDLQGLSKLILGESK